MLSVNVVVVNDDGAVLMIRRSDYGTGRCQVVGIYTDPKHVILYTSDGEARQEFSIVLTWDR